MQLLCKLLREIFLMVFSVCVVLAAAAAMLLVLVSIQIALSAFTRVFDADAATVRRVAVIDTGLDRSDSRFQGVLCPTGHWNFVDNNADTTDQHGHGTHVAGLIKQYAGDRSDYCLMIVKYYKEDSPGSVNQKNYVSAMQFAIKNGATIVNFSGGGPNFAEQEMLTIRDAPKVTFIVAAGNEKSDLSKLENRYYPASYRLKNVVPIGALTSDCKGRLGSSNYGGRVKVWEQGENLKSTVVCYDYAGRVYCEGYMSGTSMATAVHTGKVLAGNGHKPCVPQMYAQPPSWVQDLFRAR